MAQHNSGEKSGRQKDGSQRGISHAKSGSSADSQGSKGKDINNLQGNGMGLTISVVNRWKFRHLWFQWQVSIKILSPRFIESIISLTFAQWKIDNIDSVQWVVTCTMKITWSSIFCTQMCFKNVLFRDTISIECPTVTVNNHRLCYRKWFYFCFIYYWDDPE